MFLTVALQHSSYFFPSLSLPADLSVCLSISPCLHVCTVSAALICSVWFHHVAALLSATLFLYMLLVSVNHLWNYACSIEQVNKNNWLNACLCACVHVCVWERVSFVSCNVVLLTWVADVECWSKHCIDCLCAAGGTILAHDTKTHTASLWPVGHKPQWVTRFTYCSTRCIT